MKSDIFLHLFAWQFLSFVQWERHIMVGIYFLHFLIKARQQKTTALIFLFFFVSLRGPVLHCNWQALHFRLNWYSVSHSGPQVDLNSIQQVIWYQTSPFQSTTGNLSHPLKIWIFLIVNEIQTPKEIQNAHGPETRGQGFLQDTSSCANMVVTEISYLN